MAECLAAGNLDLTLPFWTCGNYGKNQNKGSLKSLLDPVHESVNLKEENVRKDGKMRLEGITTLESFILMQPK